MTANARFPLRESPYLRDVQRLPYVALLEHVLADDVCDALVARIEAGSPEVAPIMANGRAYYNPRARNNERVMFDDAPLAAELFARVRAHLPAEVDGGRLVGLNERFRGYRYRGGQRFGPHFDGAYFRAPTPAGREGSQLTVLFYLNEGFGGGETKLLDYEVAIAPRKGAVLAFQHDMFHEGAEVTSGTKYVLRSDAMYWFAGRVD